MFPSMPGDAILLTVAKEYERAAEWTQSPVESGFFQMK